MFAALTPEMKLNPYPMYTMMREQSPVLHLPEGNVWLVFRFDDVKTVLSDSETFSSEFRKAQIGAGGELAPGMRAEAVAGMAAGGPGQGMGQSLISSDPPRHTQLRNLISRAFTPRAVAALEPRIEQLTRELLDPVVAAGQFDLVEDFSAPLPVMVIAELLGIPGEDRARFKVWSDYIVASSDAILTGQAQRDPQAAVAMQEMLSYFRRTIAERRAEPREDLISSLLAAELDGDRLSEQDLLSFCWLLLVAGNETTTNLISNALLTFLEHPGTLERLRAEPELVPLAVEEVLRYRSPVQAMFRISTREVELGGQTIPAGARVIAFIGSANRDPARFSEADQFVIDRNPNPHIAFGHGIHFCLGSPLARLEAKVALTAIARRMAGVERADDAALVPVRGFIVMGVRHLPLRFTRVGE
jgi:cytochrome P450